MAVQRRTIRAFLISSTLLVAPVHSLECLSAPRTRDLRVSMLQTGQDGEVPCQCGMKKCRRERMLVTAYTDGFDSTGKRPGEPGYGITASGEIAKRGTIAAPPRFPMGTQMHVPGYGCGIVEDRGGAIEAMHIDVWMQSRQDALDFGARYPVEIEISDENQ